MANSGEGAVLGSDQWVWLDKQLSASTADLVVVVSSIQVRHWPCRQHFRTLCHQLLPGFDGKSVRGELGPLS
jgi:phosphodiesterase/alkaline phosphatase D-like protein